MEKWEKIDVDDCPQFRAGVTRLVQHVYKQTGRPLKGGGNSLYYNQIQFSFLEGKPYTTVVQIAEGCGLGAEMVYSVTAMGRQITPKFGNRKKVDLDTANFNQLLDDIVNYAHGEERKLAARLTAKFEAQEQASRQAAQKQREQREKECAEEAQRHDEAQRKRKLSQLHAQSSADTGLEGDPDAKKLKDDLPTATAATGAPKEKKKKKQPLPLDLECTESSNDGKVVSEANIEVCKCGLHKLFCSEEGCLSMYCPAAELSDTDAFFECSACDQVHCANHDFGICAECEETICYQDPSECRICDEPLCENCQSGDHEFRCMVDNGSSDPNHKLSAVEREIMGDAHFEAAQQDMEGW